MNELVDKSEQELVRHQKVFDGVILIFIFIVGMLCSIYAYRNLQENEQLRLQKTRQNICQLIIQSFEAQLSNAFGSVQFGSLMMGITKDLRPEQFDLYARKAFSPETSVAIFEWQPIVPAAQLSQFEVHARELGLANFHVVQPDVTNTTWQNVSGRAEYVPVLYSWPNNAGTAGVDMSFYPNRMESKIQSKIKGVPVASGVFDLIQKGQLASGEMAFAISNAVFEQKYSSENSSSPVAKGYLAAVIRVATLFASASKQADSAKLDLMVFDLESNARHIIYSHLGDGSELKSDTKDYQVKAFDSIFKIDVGGRPWEIVIHPRLSYFKQNTSNLASIVLAISLFFTIVLVLSIAKIQRGRRLLEISKIDLEHRVQERTQELSNAIDNLSLAHDELVRLEKASALGSMVSGIAHDLNSPIGNCMMVASAIKDKIKKIKQQFEDGITRRNINEFIDESSNGTDILIKNLEKAGELISSFKKIAIDYESEERRDFLLNEAISETLLMSAPLLRKFNIDVEFHIPADLRLNSYPGAIYQIINNLVSNCALHAFENREHGNITISALLMDQEKVKLEIKDNGVGIPDEQLPHIFKPFFTTKRGKGGSGLGLNIVFTLVKKALGGEIKVVSKVGSGTCFIITIPLSAPNLLSGPTGD